MAVRAGQKIISDVEYAMDVEAHEYEPGSFIKPGVRTIAAGRYLCNYQMYTLQGRKVITAVKPEPLSGRPTALLPRGIYIAVSGRGQEYNVEKIAIVP